MNSRRMISVATIPFICAITWALPFDAPSALKPDFSTIDGIASASKPRPKDNNPLSREAYLVSGFAEDHSGNYQFGVDYSTKDGWPIQAPEDGTLLELAESSQGLGKTILFQGKSGHLWLLGHIGKFKPSLEKEFQLRRQQARQNEYRWTLKDSSPHFKEYETLAFTGSSGRGSHLFHMELQAPNGKMSFNPCEVGISCFDSLAPRILQAAVWDNANPEQPWQFTSAEALGNSCLAVDPQYREPRLALKFMDQASTHSTHPITPYNISVHQGTALLYQRRAHALPLTPNPRRDEEFLWTSDNATIGNWLYIGTGSIPNPNVQGNTSNLSFALRSGARANDRQALRNPLRLDIADERLNSTSVYLNIRPHCEANSTAPVQGSHGAILFTHLSRPWIDLSVCKENVQVSLLDSNQWILQKQLCDSLPHVPTPLTNVLAHWPAARHLILGGSLSTPRSIALYPLPEGKLQKIHWNQPGMRWKIDIMRPLFPNVLTVERQNNTWLIQPKGLPHMGEVLACPEPTLIGAKWHWQSSQPNTDLNADGCLHLNSLGDITRQFDTTPPILGTPDSSGRIKVTDKGSGLRNANAIQASQGNIWIPASFDEDEQTIQVEQNSLQPGIPWDIQVTDRVGNVSKRHYPGHSR